MGFELGLRGTHRDVPREIIDPFTRKPAMHAPLVMSAVELDAARAVIARRGGTLDDGAGLLTLRHAAIQFYGFDAEGDLVKVIGDLRTACEFLFELATEGQLVIWNGAAADDRVASFVTTTAALARTRALDDELGTTILVTSAEELFVSLAPDHADSMAYTARVISG